MYTNMKMQGENANYCFAILNRQVCDNVKLAFINWNSVFSWYFKGYSLTHGQVRENKNKQTREQNIYTCSDL